jgi:zinc protease
MKRMSGGLRSSVAMLVVALAACSSPRSNVRFGSLVPSVRSLDYDPGIMSWKLANQLTVVMIPDPRVNLVSVEVRYMVGEVDAPPGKTGLAHLVEHVMFARRAGSGGSDIYHRLAAVALSYQGWTTWESTHYTTIGLVPRLNDLLAIEAARMADGCDGIDEAVVAHERAVVLEELAERDASDVGEALHQAVFGPGHAYSHRPGGIDVATLTRDDVCRFIDAHYAPSRAILVVSGGILRGTVQGIATRFGSIARRATGQHAVVRPIAWTGQVSELAAAVDDPGVLVMFPAAPWGSTEWIYDNLLDQMIWRKLWWAARREPWILDVSLEHFGGEHGGARGFRLRLTDARRIDDATAEVFDVIRHLPGRNDDTLISEVLSARQNELLDAFESIDTRGSWCADFLQFTAHGRFQMRELTELQHIDSELLDQRAGRLVRDISRVVRVVPSHARARAGDVAFTASASIDLPAWRAPVDPAEANRRIALPNAARTSTLSERRLANGLRIVMLPDAKQPIFEARLVFPVGEADTGSGKPGVATAAAELLSHDYQGWFTPAERRTVEWVAGLGAPVAWSVSDHTTFRVHGFSLFADAHLWRLHWLLANGRYERIDVDRMQGVATHDAAHSDHSRAGRRAMREALFGRGHPYAQDRLTALVSNAGSLQSGDLERFRDAYYRADGATLILVGRFDLDAMMRQVTELFGAWPADPPPALEPIPSPRPAAGPTWIADVDPVAVQVGVSLGFVATSPRTGRAARLVVSEMVRDRVEQVRFRLGASYGIEASYGIGVESDLLEIEGQVDAARAGEVVRQIEADLDGLRTGDAAFAADFVRARRAALVRALGDPVRTSAAADRLEAVVANHLPLDAVETLPAEIAATTVDAARAVIAQDLQIERMVLMLRGRQEDVAVAFAAAGVTGFDTVTEQPAAR